MATATSLTAETIEELMAGWEGVSVVQESQAALLSTFEAILADQTENLTEWNDVTLPALYAETEAASIALDNLIGTVIPDLQVQISGNTEDLQQLNDVVLPDLQESLNSNSDWIIEFNTTTVPDLITRLEAAEAAVETIDLGPVNAAIDALEAKFPIEGPDIAANTIEANNIAAHTITALEIAADTITANEIAADTITANEIAADTITASEIAAHTITALEIMGDTITANEIAADTITANEIAADTITANEIAADTITANEIATDAITANEIAAGAVTALEIAALTITGDKIAADTIAVTKLIVSDMTNLIVDGDLLDPTSATWYQMGAGHMTRVKPAGDRAYLANTNTYSATHIFFRNENVFEMKLGDEFFVSVEVSTPATNTVDATFNPFLAVFDRDGGSQLWRGTEEGSTSLPPNTPWTVVQGTIKIVEDGLATAQFNPVAQVAGVAAGTQEVRLRKMTLRRKSQGRLIVDGTIEGKHIKSDTITSDQIDTGTITGDLFAGEVIFGGLIRAGDMDDISGLITGGYSEMGARGIYTVDDLGSPVFYAPTASADGAFLKAHVELLSADVRDNFTMHGTNNSIAVESELTLSAGVEAPSVPPVLQEVWDSIQLNTTTAVPPHSPAAGYNMGTFSLSPSQIVSMTWDSVWSCWVVIQQKSTGFRVWRFTNTGAIYNNFGTGRPWIDDYNDRVNAATCFDSNAGGLATVFLQGAQWYIWGFTQGGVGVINKIPDSWIIDAASRPPTIAYVASANRYALIQNNGGGTGTIHIRQFTCNSGANFPNATSQTTLNTEAESGMSVRLNGAVYGSQSGITGWTIGTDDYSTVYVFNTSGALQNDEGSYRCWVKPAAALGLTHNGTQYASVDSAGKITLYEEWTWLGVDNKVWVGASAYDSDTAGNTANPHVGQTAGQHETPVGKMVSIGLHRRSKLRMTMPETNDSGAADDPDQWKLYWKRGGATEPTDKTLLKFIAAIGSPTSATTYTIGADPTGAAPPGGIKGQVGALNNFPGADPGRIESAKLMLDGGAQFQALGDGTGRWGTLTVDANGKAVIGGDTGWITMTLLNGWAQFGTAGTTYPYASYRRIGNRVFLRGMLIPGTTGTTVPIATLPVGFRPPFREIFSGNGADREFSATGDSPPTFNTGAPSAGAAHNHPVNSPALDVRVNITSYASRVDVQATGDINAANDTGSYLSLSGISFLVD